MTNEFTVGDKVRVVAMPPYVKTSDPMPMLRPNSVIHLGEEGIVIDRRPGGYWGVRFTKGRFLIDSQYIEAVSSLSEAHQPSDAISIPGQTESETTKSE